MTIRNIRFIASGAFAAALALSMLTPPALCAEPAAPAAWFSRLDRGSASFRHPAWW